MSIALLVDFGSTYTKLRAIDLEKAELVGSAQAPSTVSTDITLGLQMAFKELPGQGTFDIKLACSSAAGGLRMVAVGLVPELTSEAAKRAALGAGAKVTNVFSHKLTRLEREELRQIAPDIVLLAGGTDGGNSGVILHNARALSTLDIQSPIVIAGNKEASEQAASILEAGGKRVRVVDNVMPEINKLNVGPAREAIRSIFIENIVRAKGLDKAKTLVDDIIMPTPMATLKAAELLANGTENEEGFGEIVVVEIGGATTNIHSIGWGYPSEPGLVTKGLPEPYTKRTVEGDLGIRYNARHILEMAGEKRIRGNMFPEFKGDLRAAVDELATNTAKVPTNDQEFALDTALARTAAEIAIDRHAGQVETVYTPIGRVVLLHGKDLRGARAVIGTGGIFAYGQNPRRVLEGVLFDEASPTSLRPRNPRLYVDEHYLLFAAGLLASIAPDPALKLVKRYLRPIG